jgi:hypothetical protein
LHQQLVGAGGEGGPGGVGEAVGHGPRPVLGLLPAEEAALQGDGAARDRTEGEVLRRRLTEQGQQDAEQGRRGETTHGIAVEEQERRGRQQPGSESGRQAGTFRAAMQHHGHAEMHHGDD